MREGGGRGGLGLGKGLWEVVRRWRERVGGMEAEAGKGMAVFERLSRICWCMGQKFVDVLLSWLPSNVSVFGRS